jgi:hypothetical protein
MGINRRDFLRAAGTAAAAFSVGLAATREELLAQTTGESKDLLKVGMIGPGVQGRNVMSNCAKVPGVKFTAVCDIFPDNLQKGLEIAGEGAQSFTDYRALLEKADVDAVMIAVPLNLHCEMTLAALDAGKHVFCEKMMSYSIEQGRQMVRKQRQTGLPPRAEHDREGQGPGTHHHGAGGVAPKRRLAAAGAGPEVRAADQLAAVQGDVPGADGRTGQPPGGCRELGPAGAADGGGRHGHPGLLE